MVVPTPGRNVGAFARDRASLQFGAAPLMSQGAQFFAIARATAPDAAPHRLIGVCELLLAAGATRLEDLRDVEESDVTGLDALSPRHRRVATQLITAANSPAAPARSRSRGRDAAPRARAAPPARPAIVKGGSAPGADSSSDSASSSSSTSSTQPRSARAGVSAPPKRAAGARAARPIAARFDDAARLAQDFVPPAVGPRAALSAVAARGAPLSWCTQARASAVLGSNIRSLGSVRSALRLYLSFAKARGLEGKEFPVSRAELAVFSGLFRSEHTFANYVCHLRTISVAFGFTVAALEASFVKRIKHAVAKRTSFVPRPKSFVRRDFIERILTLASEGRVGRRLALLFALAYIFLLRLPSEALIISVSSSGAFDVAAPASVVVTESALGLRLARRKNAERPTTWWRRCWCASSRISCPVHAIGPCLASGDRDRPLFAGITSAAATEGLRDALSKAGVVNAYAYTTHAMRRGHAWDLLVGGSTVGEIKRAGGWKSGAFLRYLPADELECIAALEAHGALAPLLEESAGQRPLSHT